MRDYDFAPAVELTRLRETNKELLEALRHLVDDVTNHQDGDDRSMTLDVTAERARVAIAKAEGEPE